MKTYSITMKLPNLFFYLSLSTILFLSPFIYSQEPDADRLDEMMQALGGDKGEVLGEEEGGIGADKSGYRSFVQNELQNIFSQMDAMSQRDRDDITFEEINNQRIKLATQLCSKDQRACFLIDEYRSYLSQKSVPSSFEDLELFGQDIFSGYANDFNFYDSLPLGDDYVIKIGDQLKITMYGGFEFSEILKVDITGSISIENVGEFMIAGLTYSDASKAIKDDIANKYAGTEALISLEKIRSKQVFILGNVKVPGTYALNAFGTALNALISSGGVKDNSSLRTIQVMRGQKSIKTIDLYDLLINGDVSSSDYILNDGDSLLVGGLKSSASIVGEIIRPAIYEISDNQTLDGLIEFALGTTPFADKSNISVERLLPSGETTIYNPQDVSKFLIQNGDKVIVHSSEGQKINSISVVGAIRNAGEYSLENHKNLGDIISLQTDLLESTYTGFAVLKRLNFSSKSYRLVNFSLTNQSALNNLNLYSGDKIFIFSKDDIAYSKSKEVYAYLQQKSNDYLNSRNPFANSPLDDPKFSTTKAMMAMEGAAWNTNLIQQDQKCLKSLDVLKENPISNLISAKLDIFPAGPDIPCTPMFIANSELLPILLINSVPVVGNVRFPGLYPTARDLNALDLFNFAGGFLLSKLNIEPVFDIGIRARGFGSFSFDQLSSLTNITMLNLKLDESSTTSGYVHLLGEFKNPGIYAISQNTTLDELYERSGGLTESAYPLGGIFTRKSIKEIEAKAIERSKAELSQILASAVASGYVQQNSTDLVGLISLMSTLENVNPIGRLVTELNPIKIKDNFDINIILEDGDKIFMPKVQSTVTIVGQVLNPITVPHNIGDSFNDYIEFAGGLKKEADKGKIYAILPNGEAMRRNRGIELPVLPYLPFDRNDILPGSTIVVPRKARPLDSLALVETVTPILANLAVTAASIAAISDN